MVYGKKALLSIEFEYNTLRMVAQLDLDLSHAQRERLIQLNGLDEQRLQALLHTEVIQLQRKIWHDRSIKEKQFQEGDLALLYDSSLQEDHRRKGDIPQAYYISSRPSSIIFVFFHPLVFLSLKPVHPTGGTMCSTGGSCRNHRELEVKSKKGLKKWKLSQKAYGQSYRHPSS
eukprot:PITA_32358